VLNLVHILASSSQFKMLTYILSPLWFMQHIFFTSRVLEVRLAPAECAWWKPPGTNWVKPNVYWLYIPLFWLQSWLCFKSCFYHKSSIVSSCLISSGLPHIMSFRLFCIITATLSSDEMKSDQTS